MRHSEGPMYVVLGDRPNDTTGVRNKRGFVAFCPFPHFVHSVDDWQEKRAEAQREWHETARQLAAAFTSYQNAFGPGAVAAAEADLLKEALEACEAGLAELLQWYGKISKDADTCERFAKESDAVNRLRTTLSRIRETRDVD